MAKAEVYGAETGTPHLVGQFVKSSGKGCVMSQWHRRSSNAEVGYKTEELGFDTRQRKLDTRQRSWGFEVNT